MKMMIENLPNDAVAKRGIEKWPVWTKEVSRFDWYYDSNEECLIVDGEAKVEYEGKTQVIKAGDFVTFKKGLRCVWNVIKPIKKYYNFP